MRNQDVVPIGLILGGRPNLFSQLVSKYLAVSMAWAWTKRVVVTVPDWANC